MCCECKIGSVCQWAECILFHVICDDKCHEDPAKIISLYLQLNEIISVYLLFKVVLMKGMVDPNTLFSAEENVIDMINVMSLDAQ